VIVETWQNVIVILAFVVAVLVVWWLSGTDWARMRRRRQNVKAEMNRVRKFVGTRSRFGSPGGVVVWGDNRVDDIHEDSQSVGTEVSQITTCEFCGYGRTGGSVCPNCGVEMI